MAASKQPEDYLPTVLGGVVCRAGVKAVGVGETVTNNDDSRRAVKDMFNIDSSDAQDLERIFKRGPWKNYFLVESYRKSMDSDDFEYVERGTAFLTDLVRKKNKDGEEDGEAYATFLTAGHVLFGYDRVVLKHSSQLHKSGEALKKVKSFMTIDDECDPDDEPEGWWDVSSKFKFGSPDPYDYGAIFVKKDYLQVLMETRGMSLDGELFTVRIRPLDRDSTISQVPVFVAGFPKKWGNDNKAECKYLMVGEDGNYLPHHSLPDAVVKNVSSEQQLLLPEVDVHTVDTSEGMSGSPVVLGNFPMPQRPDSSASAEPRCDQKVIAIHVSGVDVDEKYRTWAINAPEVLKQGKGMNCAVPIDQDLLDDLHLELPNS